MFTKRYTLATDRTNIQRIKGINALDYAKRNSWLDGNMPSCLYSICNLIEPFKEFYVPTMSIISRSSFIESGISDEEYEHWRYGIFPKLHTIWIIGALEPGESNSRLNGTTFNCPDLTRKLLSEINPNEVSVGFWDIERDIGYWYIENFVNKEKAIDIGKEKGEHNITDCVNNKDKGKTLENNLVTSTDKNGMPTNLIYNENKEANKNNTQEKIKKRRKGNLPPITMEDIQKNRLSHKDVIKHWQSNQNVAEDEDNEYLKKDLSNKALEAIRKNEQENGGQFKPPVRISATTNGRWHRYVVLQNHKGKEGNKYGLIKEDVR